MGLLKKIAICASALVIAVPLATCAQEEQTDYERSSMHVMMIKHMNQGFDETVEKTFKEMPCPERFNDHNLGVKSVAFAESSKDLSPRINEFFQKVNIGQKVVAKWFDRNKTTGSFDLDLIRARGFYNASQNDINQARASMRGKALLEDAGENLISKTYVLVNDISYSSKSSAGSYIKMFAAAYISDVSAMSNAMESIGGFSVKITSYLYRLKWNDDIANKFYTEYYTEDGTKDADKVAAFKADKTTFEMELVGQTETSATETHFSKSKSPADLLKKVLTRGLDKNIAELQHTYPDFRIKAPLINVSPLQAYIGKKEDVKESTIYEVLQRVEQENGSIKYEVVGTVKPVAGKIYDNRYESYEDDGVDTSLKATTFERVSGKDFAPGMLLREK